MFFGSVEKRTKYVFLSWKAGLGGKARVGGQFECALSNGHHAEPPKRSPEALALRHQQDDDPNQQGGERETAVKAPTCK